MMVAVSVMIEGQDGLTWERWDRIAATAEDYNFAGLFRSDHFTNPHGSAKDSLETIISLAYLAFQTRRIHFGPLVAPVSFRDPIMLARQAAAIDDASGGRVVLGLGAGWQEREHHAFGYPLGDRATRMNRLEEGLEVVTRLLRSDEPTTFEGTFYQLRDAVLLPRPARPGGPAILIGGNGPLRTLPLAARYADWWNGTNLTPDDFQTRSRRLDDLLRQHGREPGVLRRTMMTRLVFARDHDELARLLGPIVERRPELAPLTLDERISHLRASGGPIAGTSDMVLDQIRAYGQAGVEELMLQWFELDDIERLRAFGEQVVPQLG